MMEGSVKLGHTWTDEERVEAAMMIWNKEKGTAAAVILFSWLAKVRAANNLPRCLTKVSADILCRPHIFLRKSSPPWILPFSSKLTSYYHEHPLSL
jgi:hypothetical protein